MTLTPTLHALAWSLLHALWQGAACWSARELLDGVLPATAVHARHQATLTALGAVVALWLGTFFALAVPAGSTAAVVLPEAAPALTAFLACWSTGVVVLGLRLAGGLYTLRRLEGRATPAPPMWQARLEELARASGLNRPIRLLTTAELTAPVVYGWLRPVILAPPALWLQLPPEQAEAILLHELSHLRRHDWVISLLLSAIEVVLCHVPFVWRLTARAREEREACCDRLASEALGDSLTYARALLSLAGTAPTLAPSSHGGSLMNRVQLLLRPESTRARPPAWALAVHAALLFTLLCAATVTPVSRAAIDWLPDQVARWTPEVDKAAARHGIDPELLALVVLMESRGNPQAVSSMGARGLVQLLPGTARRIAEARGLPEPTLTDLDDPATNLDLGAWFLARQLEAFAQPDPERTVEHALAAYNGGPNTVRAWLSGEAELSEETQRYKAIGLALWQERHEVRSPTLDTLRGSKGE
jgi:beta-lactamase regulating signal transducer with metallopeptidase domain